MGTPSFFIRTSGCNLRCRWCDTPYTSWRPEGRSLSVAQICEAARAAGLRHLVLTGGEPLLQREVGELTGLLAAAGHHITVETAGTVAPAFTCHLLSVSPKTANSTPEGSWQARHERRRRDPAALLRLLAAHPNYQLKFVLQGAQDMPEILQLLGEIAADPGRVVLMPEGRTAEEVRQRADEVAACCVTYGFRYSPRLHLELFGARRGA